MVEVTVVVLDSQLDEAMSDTEAMNELIHTMLDTVKGAIVDAMTLRLMDKVGLDEANRP